MSRLKNLVEQLAEIRSDAEKAKAAYEQKLKSFLESETMLELKRLVNEAETELKDIDTIVREEALRAYEKYPENKHPHPAILIAETRIVEIIADNGKLLNWTKAHVPNALVINMALLRSHILAVAKTQPVQADIATVRAEPRAKIDQDLSQYIRYIPPSPTAVDLKIQAIETGPAEEAAHAVPTPTTLKMVLARAPKKK